MCIGDFSPTWKEAAEADIAEDSATSTNTTIPTSHSQLRFVIYICFVQLWRCKDAVLPACFFFPRAAACLILACLITFICRSAAFHTHTHFRPGVGLARGREAGTGCVLGSMPLIHRNLLVGVVAAFWEKFFDGCFYRRR